MGSDTTEPTRYDPDITDRLRHEDSMNPDRSEYRHEVLGRAASEIEALREQLRQAEQDRDVLGAAIDRIAEQWTPKHVINTDLDRVVVEAIVARKQTRCKPASGGETLDDGHGNRWDKCGPNCTLHVVRPGKAQCEGDGGWCPNQEVKP